MELHFFVSSKRHHQRQAEKILDMLQYCIYEEEYELKELYGGPSSWRVWTKFNFIGPKSFDDWHFNEPYFAIDGVYESDVNKTFNSTKDISNTVEIIDAPSNLKYILDKQRTNIRKKR